MAIEENMAAGICKLYTLFSVKFNLITKKKKIGVGAILFFLGITRTIHLIGAFTPTPIIKGKDNIFVLPCSIKYRLNMYTVNLF